MAERSRILIIGGTGHIGKFIVEASAKSGHPTFLLVRESTLSVKAALLEKFTAMGVALLKGDMYDHGSLVKAMNQVDVVISTVGFLQLADQTKIIDAIKDAGGIKRFFPSEFGNDVDRVQAVEPARSVVQTKVKIRRAVGAAQGIIPYTYVSANFFAGLVLPSLAQLGATAPPTDKFIVFGDGNPKAVFVKEEDIATYTIKAVDDPRTLNKVLYLRPPGNAFSFNDLASLWESKIGKTLQRIHISEEQLLKDIRESPTPMGIVLATGHSVFVKGDQSNFAIEPSFGVEASQLYPEVKHTTVSEYLDQFVVPAVSTQ